MTANPNGIEEALRAYYQSQTLSLDGLQRAKSILAEQQNSWGWRLERRALGRGKHVSVGRRIAVIAAGILVVAMAVGWLMQRENDPAQSVAREIATNHLKGAKVEFPADQFSELGDRMDRLGFAPIQPARLSEYDLAGARYCSVSGRMAAQIKLVDSAGQVSTLYQWQDPSDDSPFYEGTYDVGEIRVQLWAESGLRLGWARTRPK